MNRTIDSNSNDMANEPQAKPRTSATVQTSPFSEDPINILLVDDEPKNLTVLETVLADPAYRLVRATSADEALLALVVEEFALIILDIRMPGMTGFELAQMIKERKKTARVPIIFLTAFYNEDQHVLEGYGTGAVDYLHKPVNPAIIRSKVSVFADLHRKSREVSSANRALLAEVTERRRAEERLRELNDTLEQRVLQRTLELHESEKRMRLAQDAACIGTFDWNIKTGMLGWTPELEALYGLSPENFGGKYEDWVRLIHSEDRAEVTHLIQQSFEKGLPVEGEWRVTWPDGSIHWLLGRFQVFKEDNGAPLYMTGVNLDITKRKRAEEALRETDRHKDEFLATLAHELRNPLAPIRNAVEILRLRGSSPQSLQWAINVIDRQIVSLTRLIDDLMDVNRISRGKLELRRERIELAHVVQEAVESVRPFIEKEGHQLSVQLPPQAIHLFADPIRLAQVFLNLLNNAAKFSTTGGRIDLLAERQGSDVVISVKDSGIGIPSNKLVSIFEMFSQIEGSLARSQGGLGIGLSLVKRLVEMHEGHIEARSEGLDLGSEFVVRLPMISEHRPVCDDNENHAAKEIPASDLHILVVDDNKEAATSLMLLLEQMGNTTLMANDGEGAVEMTIKYRPDVVLLDIGLPKMNGYDAARAIRQEPWGQSTFLVAMTGWGQEEDKRRSKEAGFDRHLVKPVEPQTLMKLLAELQSEQAKSLAE